MARLRPLLESLEGRYSPAVAADVSAGAAESARVAALFDAGGTESRFSFPVPAAPLELFAEGASPFGGGQVFFSPPSLPDPLMSQIGRLPEPSLKFPASGGGGHVRVSEEMALLSPAVSPAPVGDQPDADAIGAEHATPDAEASELA
jgi:hypothetical protein